jgi:hypothetical protein
MLPRVGLVEQWRRIEARLPAGWTEARLRLRVADADSFDRAAWLLGPANPLRTGRELRFEAHRAGRFPSPELVRRLLRRLDEERIGGSLDLLAAEQAAPAPEAATAPSLVAAWEDQLARLPEDWSDLFVELRLLSSDFLERAALDLAPVNPSSFGDRQTLRFRVARRFGYGASPGVVRACLARCDRDRIRGTITVLRALSETQPVATQGPVWYAGGRVV